MSVASSHDGACYLAGTVSDYDNAWVLNVTKLWVIIRAAQQAIVDLRRL